MLVRHGETLHNVAGVAQGWGDSELSGRGQQQVARVAERLKNVGADALFSSPLQRALTTAQKISESTGLEIHTLDDLREMNYGRWEGQKFLDVRKVDEEDYQRWISDDEFACPEGESHAQVRARIARALGLVAGFSVEAGFSPPFPSGGLKPASTQKRAIVVTHGTAIRVAVTVLLGLPLSASRNFAQDNAAINMFNRRGDHWVLKSWNDHDSRTD
ncbi:MAG TPA: histidine phosphatase family protein [Thermoanaerobaculia bacterium]